jgi:hypothetical protein
MSAMPFQRAPEVGSSRGWGSTVHILNLHHLWIKNIDPQMMQITQMESEGGFFQDENCCVSVGAVVLWICICRHPLHLCESDFKVKQFSGFFYENVF